MDYVLEDFSWFYVVSACVLLKYVFFYVLHRVYGERIHIDPKSKRNVSFRTSRGRFQINNDKQAFLYKQKGDKNWHSIDFKNVSDIHIFSETDTASLIEFFLGDFFIIDFLQKYRDLLHTHYIRLRGVGDNADIEILKIKQYDQREFWLGHYFYMFDVWLMTRLGLYKNIDNVSEDKIEELLLLFKRYGFEPRYEKH